MTRDTALKTLGLTEAELERMRRSHDIMTRLEESEPDLLPRLKRDYDVETGAWGWVGSAEVGRARYFSIRQSAADALDSALSDALSHGGVA